MVKQIFLILPQARSAVEGEVAGADRRLTEGGSAQNLRNPALAIRTKKEHHSFMESPDQTEAFARELRRQMSLPEVMLWKVLRRRGLEGLRFRRQHPIGPYVLDFYCVTHGLAVEVDGASHYDQDRAQRDLRRDAWLAGKGIRTLRLRAGVVLGNMTSATATILAAIDLTKAGTVTAERCQPPEVDGGGSAF